MKLFPFLMALLFQFYSLNAQDFKLANPYVINHSKSEYKGGTENWKILTSSTGIILAANNEGLLRFDGNNWTIYKLPNKTIVRSIAMDTIKNRIYAGGQDEVGYFSASKNGELKFTSIKSLLPEKFSSIEDVWDIQIGNESVFFRSVNTIFKYDGQKIEVLSTKSRIINSLKILNNVIYYADPTKGLFKIEGETETFIKGSEGIINHRVSSMINFSNNEILIVTEKNGIYTYNGTVITKFLENDFVKNAIITSAVKLSETMIALGTVLEGIVIIDKINLKKWSINKQKGLQTNNVIDLTIDNHGDIWAGTTNGIDQILINSPYSIMYPDGDLQGSVYAVKIFQNKLYVGTNSGLFYTNWPTGGYNQNSSSFSKVTNSNGQVWSLDIVNEELFMGHNEGLFLIEKNNAIKISPNISGTWKSFEIKNTNLMLTGTYEGFQLFKKENNTWKYVKNIEGFKESARIITMDKANNIWVSHPYRGVYRLTFNQYFSEIQEIKNFGLSQGLSSDLSNYVTRLNDDIYVTSESGVFKYNTNKKIFSVDSTLTSLIGKNINTRRLFQQNSSDIWYVNENDCGVLKILETPTSKIIKKQSTPFLNDKLIGGFENIYIQSDEHVFVCTDKGLIDVDMKKLESNRNIHLRFNQIENSGYQTECIYGGNGVFSIDYPELKYSQNNLKISLGTNILDVTEPVLYSYILEGQEKNWSEWSILSEKEFNNLSPGKYTYKAKAKDSKGNISNEIVFQFKIHAPWYATLKAKAIYTLVFLSLFYYLLRRNDKKHQVEKSLLKQEKEESDAKVQELLNEKLQTEIDFKNKELALSTMHNVQKNETLSKLREELSGITTQAKDSETKKQIKKVISILSDDQRLEEDWESFAVHFDQVHTDFLRRIKDEFPQLSTKDLKLCAYLRLNLTTKEIAPLFNISVRGVEISRYRLRKKMELDTEINLNDFMMQY